MEKPILSESEKQAYLQARIAHWILVRTPMVAGYVETNKAIDATNELCKEITTDYDWVDFVSNSIEWKTIKAVLDI